nr:hypothetical protein CFP56_03155 [Quercus suber]
MAYVAPTANEQLDLLQAELEQTGRIFAAANSGTKTASAVLRLKQTLPGSISRFHDALDDLEDQLETAKLVMRRDLALWRSRTGHETEVHPSLTPANPLDAAVGKSAEDAVMADVENTTRGGDNTLPEVKALKDELPVSDSAAKGTNNDAGSPHANSAEPSEAADTTADPKREASSDNHALHIVTKPENTASDTEGQLPTDDDNPPDTGTFSNNADLDSLFNDPISAGGGGDNPPTDFDPNGDFDFGSFNASLGDNNHNNDGNDNDDNDNISALLPGLQDYANNIHTSGQPDFDALFATDVPAGDDNGNNNPPGDSTFDDLMDFADFNAGGENNDDLDLSFI